MNFQETNLTLTGSLASKKMLLNLVFPFWLFISLFFYFFEQLLLYIVQYLCCVIINILASKMKCLVFLAILVGVNALLGQITYGGLWGIWQRPVWAPENYYLCGGQIRNDDDQGGGDDTAVNGISFIFCSQKNWNQKWERWWEGSWGQWKYRAFCPFDYFVNAMKIRFQGGPGIIDNTAINGVKYMCVNSRYQQKQITIFEGLWGSWSDWIKPQTLKRMPIVGYNIRSQPNQGSGVDDTALNGISLFNVNRYRILKLKFSYQISDDFELKNTVIQERTLDNSFSSPVTMNISTNKKNGTQWSINDISITGGVINPQSSIKFPALKSDGKFKVEEQNWQTFVFNKYVERKVPSNQKVFFSFQCPPCTVCNIQITSRTQRFLFPFSVNIEYDDGDIIKTKGLYQESVYADVVGKIYQTNSTKCKRHHHMDFFE